VIFWGGGGGKVGWGKLLSSSTVVQSPVEPSYARRVDPSVLAFSLSSHRHTYVSLLFNSRFITE
jgi:hypothetical protein